MRSCKNTAKDSAVCESKTANNHCASSCSIIFADACRVSFFVFMNNALRAINLTLLGLLDAVISGYNMRKSKKAFSY